MPQIRAPHLKQMEAEAQRIERRLQEWTLQAARNKEAREAKHAVIEQKREEAVRLEAERTTAEATLEQLQTQLAALRQQRETLQVEAAQLTAELAGLEERRRGAEAAFQRIDRLHADLERRVLAIQQQRAAAEAEREQRIRESAELAQRELELTASRAEALAQAEAVASQALALRQQLASMETQLKAGRIAIDQLREDRGRRASEAAKLTSDLEHLEASCLTEVNVEAATLRADADILRIAGEELGVEEETCRTLRQRIEQMGPVNMMALEEYKETADRHGFLETQRKDLMESTTVRCACAARSPHRGRPRRRGHRGQPRRTVAAGQAGQRRRRRRVHRGLLQLAADAGDASGSSRESPAAAIAGELMGARTVRLYHDHVLVKEPGTRQRTPWHQDQPYYNVDGHQNASMWFPVDPVPRESTLEFVAGSHRGPWYMPRSFLDDQAKWFPDGTLAELPDIDGRPDGSASSAGSSSRATRCSSTCSRCTPPAASAGPSRRRVLSVRFLGDDIVHAPRPWATSPPFPGSRRRARRRRADGPPAVPGPLAPR